jgi:hypothetical protein
MKVSHSGKLRTLNVSSSAVAKTAMMIASAMMLLALMRTATGKEGLVH